MITVTHDGQDVTMKHEDPGEDEHEYQCLIRATNGKNINFSTRVRSLHSKYVLIFILHTHQINPFDLQTFYSAYATLLKSSLSHTLRKRDKKKEKTKQEQAAKRKKRMTETLVVNGPKRGAGRRKRQRQIKALVKQDEARKKFKEREEKKGAGR
jgi:signal recognition particle subunit SRP14